MLFFRAVFNIELGVERFCRHFGFAFKLRGRRFPPAGFC